VRKPKAELRLPPMLQDYVDDLLKEGTYGDSKSEVMRRFIDEGIRRALNEGRIAKRNSADYAPSGD
jgi:Arc/MetJ-type ribon-helix-helix transcriptional regulator